jgi:hypothetical protein
MDNLVVVHTGLAHDLLRVFLRLLGLWRDQLL